MNPKEYSELKNNRIKAAEKMDWGQVVLNGGPPCFQLDPDSKCFCGRAERWHGHDDEHKFVSLADLLRFIWAIYPKN